MLSAIYYRVLILPLFSFASIIYQSEHQVVHLFTANNDDSALAKYITVGVSLSEPTTTRSMESKGAPSLFHVSHDATVKEARG